MRKVKEILYATEVDMGGIPVRQPLPTARVEQVDPFLLLHHHTASIEAGGDPKDLGVGPHPHRGFAPVTFIFQGDVHHRDSRGNSSIVYAGGVQWMNAGMGIIHSERPSGRLVANGGVMEIIQLWINTPKQHKMNQPKYYPFETNQLVHLTPSEGKGDISVVSGEQDGKKGPVEPLSPILSLSGFFDENASHTFQVSKEMNLILYLLDGEIDLEGYGMVEGKNMVYFENDDDRIQFTARKPTRFLLVAGEPLNEPIATFGPFVMNSQTEIMEAMRDYQKGKMGVLIEEF